MDQLRSSVKEANERNGTLNKQEKRESNLLTHAKKCSFNLLVQKIEIGRLRFRDTFYKKVDGNPCLRHPSSAYLFTTKPSK